VFITCQKADKSRLTQNLRIESVWYELLRLRNWPNTPYRFAFVLVVLGRDHTAYRSSFGNLEAMGVMAEAKYFSGIEI
jgi:hypothetical protein